MALSFLMLGSNLGDRQSLLEKAVELLGLGVGKVLHKSLIYESEPWGFSNSNWFLNQAVAVETELPAIDLLHAVLQIEQQLGRIRYSKEYEARTIDIDILFYNDYIIETPGLMIPHPLMAQRLFVLAPLADIAPLLLHPVLKRTISELKDACTDPMAVRLFKA